MTIEDFYELSPSEVALLWLSPDEEEQAGDATRIICSKPTLLIGCLLAEGYASVDGNIDRERLTEAIESYSQTAVDSMRSRNFMVRYDFGIRHLLYFLDQVGFPFQYDGETKTRVLHEPYHEYPVGNSKDLIRRTFDLTAYEKETSRYTQLYHTGSNLFNSAIRSMEDKDLIIDPPWLNKKNAATTAAIILLGSIPLDISVKTSKGNELVKTVKVQTSLWEYNKVSSKKLEETHINIKIARFVEGVISDMSKSLIVNWSKVSNVELPKKMKNKEFKTDSSLSSSIPIEE